MKVRTVVASAAIAASLAIAGAATATANLLPPEPAGIPSCSDAAHDNEMIHDPLLRAWMARRCDYRVTGEPCHEDQWCALREIDQTGAFSLYGSPFPAGYWAGEPS